MTANKDNPCSEVSALSKLYPAVVVCLLIAGAAFTFLGCEDSKIGEGESFSISPSEVTLTEPNQSVTLQVVGGNQPFVWSVSDSNTLGRISGSGHSVTYVRTGTANGVNVITVTDDKTWTATARVTQIDKPTALTISANSTSLGKNGDLAVITASGGLPPYRWEVSSAALGSVDKTTGTSVVYVRNHAGNNAVTVRDNAGQLATLIITQP